MINSASSDVSRVAYLAPEIPALSATFVYNEILALERQGIDVVPITVHQPNAIVEGNADVEALAARTHYLYQKSLAQFLYVSILFLLSNPVVYLRAVGAMVQDVFKVGLFSRIGVGLIYRFLASASVAEILKKQRCTHLHVHFAHIPTDIAMYSAMLAGIPFSFTSHANDLFQRGWLLKEKVDRAKFCVTISEYNKKYLMQHGAQESSVHVVHCGVDSAAFGALSDKNSNDKLVIGSLGRAVEKKGFDILLDTVPLLKQQGITLQIQLAGDGPLLPLLQQQAARLGITDDVEFCGAIAHDNVSTWLQTLDLFVLPCQRDANGDMDGIPVVLMEAMMVGVPVISTRISGIPELVVDNVTGLLAQPGDSDSLAQAIVCLQGNKNLRQSLVNSAVALVQDQFDLNKNTARLAKLFNGTQQ